MATELTVSWIFDVISPFAYLGVKQLQQLPAHVRVEFVRLVLWRARKVGIPPRFPPAHPFNPLAALRLIIAAATIMSIPANSLYRRRAMVWVHL